MIEFKLKHVMNIIFNHVLFFRLGGTGYQAINQNYIMMKPSCYKSTKDYENILQSWRFHTNRLIYNNILTLFSCEKEELNLENI